MTPHLPQGGRRLLGLVGLIATSLAASAADLGTDAGLARIDWKFEQPAESNPIVETDANGTMSPVEDVTMTVRALGVGASSGQKLLPVDASWTLDGESPKRFFYGDNRSIEDGRVIVESAIAAGTGIDFSARVWNQGWQQPAATGEPGSGVSVLRDGDLPVAGSEILAPFLTDGRKLELGPRERIVVWHAADRSVDFAILVRFD